MMSAEIYTDAKSTAGSDVDKRTIVDAHHFRCAYIILYDVESPRHDLVLPACLRLSLSASCIVLEMEVLNDRWTRGHDL